MLKYNIFNATIKPTTSMHLCVLIFGKFWHFKLHQRQWATAVKSDNILVTFIIFGPSSRGNKVCKLHVTNEPRASQGTKNFFVFK